MDEIVFALCRDTEAEIRDRPQRTRFSDLVRTLDKNQATGVSAEIQDTVGEGAKCP
jgi:hypothetical protein